MFLFFDTETTGLPKNWKAPASFINNWPRIIQIAWVLVDQDQKTILAEERHLIKPDGWNVPKGTFWESHGFSHEKSLAEGEPIADILDKFIEDLKRAKLLIAHNMSFDHPVVTAECIRLRKRLPEEYHTRCTKQIGTNICQIPHANGRGYKWPTLFELHNYLFKEGFTGAHDALVDVKACMRCYFEIMTPKSEPIVTKTFQDAKGRELKPIEVPI